jgi:hypothetical protein
MKKIIIVFFISFVSLSGISQTFITYSDGIRDGITRSNEIKDILLNSGYSTWGWQDAIIKREINDNGSLGAIITTPTPGKNWVFVVRHNFIQAGFNAVAYSDISVQTHLAYLEGIRYLDDYGRGQYDGFTNHWFFEDYSF